MFSFCVGFYNFAFLLRYGIQTTCIVYAGTQLACFVPMLVLMMKGAQWRDNFSGPDWNLDL
jgi:hypothetical protein